MSHKKVKVNLFMIGAMRSGSTSLYYYLSQHPEIFMSPVKEPEYFSRNILKNSLQECKDLADDERENIIKNLSNKKDRSLAEYEQLFVPGQNIKIVGEASQYLFYPTVAEVIHQYNPDAKILVIVRNPVDRLYSDYYYNARTGLLEALEFNDYVKQLLIEEEKYSKNKLLPSSHLAFGYYFKQLKLWYEYFDKKNIKVVLYEDLNELDKLTNELFNWLEVDPDFVIKQTRTQQSGSYRLSLFRNLLDEDNIVKHAIKKLISEHSRRKLREIAYKILLKKKQGIEDKTRQTLINIYQDDVQNFEQLINRDLSDWYRIRH